MEEWRNGEMEEWRKTYSRDCDKHFLRDFWAVLKLLWKNTLLILGSFLPLKISITFEISSQILVKHSAVTRLSISCHFKDSEILVPLQYIERRTKFTRMSSATSINITKNRENWNLKQKPQGNDSNIKTKLTEHLKDFTVLTSSFYRNDMLSNYQ